MKGPLQMIGERVQALDEKGALTEVRQALAAGATSLQVVKAAEQGMRGVGERYERQEIFLSGLIMASEIFRAILEVVQPGLRSELLGQTSGRVLLGTVAGDIHDLGKNMVALFLQAYGFTVEDLGVNVAPARFLEAADRFNPDVVGLSGLVSAAFVAMRETVVLLRKPERVSGRQPVLVIGGATIDDEVAAQIGADYWTTDAMQGVRICQVVVQGQEISG